MTPAETPPKTGTTDNVLDSKGVAFKTREGLLSPNALVAVTEHAYSAPAVSPSTAMGLAVPFTEVFPGVQVARSLDVIRGELKRMADDGPTATELANAKSYLTGSFTLRFDTNAKIANQLLWMLQEDMGIDYVEKRNALIDAVTLDDVKRVAKRQKRREKRLARKPQLSAPAAPAALPGAPPPSPGAVPGAPAPGAPVPAAPEAPAAEPVRKPVVSARPALRSRRAACPVFGTRSLFSVSRSADFTAGRTGLLTSKNAHR